MISAGGGVSGAGKYPIETVYLPPGTFQMGCDDRNKCDSDETPAHTVTLTQGTRFMTTPVTEGMMEELKKKQPDKFKDIKTTCDIDEPRGLVAWFLRLIGEQPKPRTETCNMPLVNVDWNQAGDICQAVGMRRPTEAEYEYAAHGVSGKDVYATANDGQLKDAQGNPLARYGTLAGRGIGKEFLPNSWGIYGLSGNVWQWVNDWYGPYSSGAITDPMGPATGNYRVLRGGSWGSDGFAYGLRAAIRFYDYPGGRDDKFGVRCAVSVPPEDFRK